MKKILFALFVVAFSSNHSSAQELRSTNGTQQATEKIPNQKKEDPNQAAMPKSIYDFTVKDISGKDFPLVSLKGKKVMIVNTASQCGLTPQYKDLEKLYEQYKDKNFVIIGFPANNFAGQEPGANKEIATFCQKNYGVTFPMMSKISVVGEDMAPLYKFLTQKDQNGLQDSAVQWNFQKYLIDENGKLVKVIPPKTLPTDDSVIAWLKS